MEEKNNVRPLVKEDEEEISVPLDEANALLIKNIYAARDQHMAEFNKNVDSNVSIICTAFLNAKGLEGTWGLSQDGTTMVKTEPPKEDEVN